MGAVTAFRLWIQRAQHPHDDGMSKEFYTLLTKIRPIQDLGWYRGMLEGEGIPETMLVMSVAVHGKEPDQLVGVLLDLFRAVRAFDPGLIHRLIYSMPGLCFP